MEYTYLSYAEDDYKYLMADFQEGKVANAMAYTAQNACEKYLKHLIQVGVHPATQKEEGELKDILRIHSLNALMKHIDRLIEPIPDDIKDVIEKADGYYFSARYPGDDSIMVDKRDINKCMAALEACRNYVFSKVQELEASRSSTERKSVLASLAEKGNLVAAAEELKKENRNRKETPA